MSDEMNYDDNILNLLAINIIIYIQLFAFSEMQSADKYFMYDYHGAMGNYAQWRRNCLEMMDVYTISQRQNGTDSLILLHAECCGHQICLIYFI